MKNLSFKPILFLASLFSLLITSNLKAQDLQTAIMLTKSEQYDEAEVAFNQLIQKEPAVSKNYFYFGETYLLSYFADTISNSLKINANQAREVYNKGVTLWERDTYEYPATMPEAKFQEPTMPKLIELWRVPYL